MHFSKKIKDRWNAECTTIGKFIHKYVSLIILAASCGPDILIWAGTLPVGTVPNWFLTAGLIAGTVAKVGGKLTVKSESPQ